MPIEPAHPHTIGLLVIMHVDSCTRLGEAMAKANRLIRSQCPDVVSVKALDGDCGDTWIAESLVRDAIDQALRNSPL